MFDRLFRNPFGRPRAEPDLSAAPFADLRRACVEGSEAARRAFVRRYEPVAWRAVIARLPHLPRQDQEEVVADTFIALLRDDAELLRRYDPLKGLSPEGWIRRQALLQANNRARAAATTKRSSEQLSRDPDDHPETRLPDHAPDPERALAEHQDLHHLMGTLEAGLPPALRLTFEMLYVRELDAAEAAEALGCSMESLYTRKRRLLLAVQALLGEGSAGEEA